MSENAPRSLVKSDIHDKRPVDVEDAFTHVNLHTYQKNRHALISFTRPTNSRR